MKKRLIVLSLLAVGVIILLVYLSSPSLNHRPHSITLYGNVDVRQVDLGFQVPGRVETMTAQEGDLIAPGALLGVLDKRSYIDQVKQAEANVTALRVSVANAAQLLQRRLDLVSRGAVAKEDLENAQATHDELTANLKQAEAALGIAQTNLAYTEVYAPSEGVILTRIREPGTVVNASDPIYTLSITNPIWIRAYVSEPQLGLIYPDMEAEISTDTPGGKIYKGRIGFISPVAEFTPKTVETTYLRTDLVYRLRIYISHPDKELKQGMPVTVHIPVSQGHA